MRLYAYFADCYRMMCRACPGCGAVPGERCRIIETQEPMWHIHGERRK